MQGAGMETYLTIEEIAAYLKLAVQTIRRYVLHREIPFHKIWQTFLTIFSKTPKFAHFPYLILKRRTVFLWIRRRETVLKMINRGLKLKNYRKLPYFSAPPEGIFDLCGCGKPAVYIF
jgi:excisionase family DNA binding protein